MSTRTHSPGGGAPPLGDVEELQRCLLVVWGRATVRATTPWRVVYKPTRHLVSLTAWLYLWLFNICASSPCWCQEWCCSKTTCISCYCHRNDGFVAHSSLVRDVASVSDISSPKAFKGHVEKKREIQHHGEQPGRCPRCRTPGTQMKTRVASLSGFRLLFINLQYKRVCFVDVFFSPCCIIIHCIHLLAYNR